VNPWSTVAPWWLVVAGWSVLVALWHTSVVALAFATWRLWWYAAPARTQYAVASSALGLATVLTLATPAMLLIGGRTIPPIPTMQAPTIAAISATPTATAPGGSSLVTGPVAWRRTARAVTSAAPWIGAAWCLGFAIGVIRLCGGWGLAQWIRRRATVVSSAQIVDAAREAAVAWSLPAAPVLASAHVEAPVVIGARAPAVLLPVDLEQRLDGDALRPLLAHELAHVDRRDYAANLLQSFADTLLFFSPGARWLSRSVRESREYCCDDLVAARCGAGAYASALTTLAGLGVAARARPAVNAAGPRLIVRIRRLLQEDAMIPFVTLRLAGFGMSVVLVAAAGGSLVPLSVAALEGAPRPSTAAAGDAPVPIGWVNAQPGAAVELRTMTSTEAGACGVATVENRADVPVIGLRFVGVAHYSRVAPSEALDGALATTDLLDVMVPPGSTTTVAVNLLPPDDLRQSFDAGRFQAMCAIQAIRYGNGVEWTSTPAVIFAKKHAEVSRAFLGRDTSGHAHFCRDENGAEYSQGALVTIALEPGRRARCAGGVWSEVANPARTPGAPFVWMDLRVESGHTPALGVEPGGMVQLGLTSGRNWGLRPTVDTVDESRVQLDVFDLSATPHAKVAELALRVGESLVDVPGAPFAVRIRSTRTP
jgi:beta-lactamase regulating signal transducer with metallopeptidase domain